IVAAARLAGSLLLLSQKLLPMPSCRTTRFDFTSSLAKSARTALSALASPRHSACHWPPPNGGPSHQAIRAVTLKIAAAPVGQPGSRSGLFPSPPVINANTSGERTARIAVDRSTRSPIPKRVRAVMGSTLRAERSITSLLDDEVARGF